MGKHSAPRWPGSRVCFAATPQQIADHDVSGRGIHWDKFDEDSSIDGLLAGQGDLTRHRRQVA
jgi:hypothetical protein